MSAIAALYNVPENDVELLSWASAHARHHQDIVNYIYRTGNVSLDQYVLEPIDPKNTGGWAYHHQIMHQQMDALLGIEGFDLTNVNFNDHDELPGWILLNANEHYQADNLLRISVPFIPTTGIQIAYTDHQQITASGFSYTFTGLNFGTPNANRYIVVALGWGNATALRLLTCTIGGVGASILVATPLFGGMRTAICMALVPAGATGSVAITLESGGFPAGGAAVSVFSMTGVSTLGASMVATSLASNPNATLNVAAGGTIIGVVSAARSPAPTATWVGLTERDDDAFGPSSILMRSSASASFSSSQLGVVTGAQLSATTGNANGCFAVFNP